MERLVLTIAQARSLQRNEKPWPADWAFMLIGQREKPDTVPDPQRMQMAIQMKARGCADDHVAEQLGWKPDSTPIRQTNRLIKHLAQ